MPHLKTTKRLFLSISATALMMGCSTSLSDRSPFDIASNSVRRTDVVSGQSEVLAPEIKAFASNHSSVKGQVQLRTAGPYTDENGIVHRDGAFLEILLDYATATPNPEDALLFDQAYWPGGEPAMLADFGTAVLDCREDAREIYRTPDPYFGIGYFGYGTGYGRSRGHGYGRGYGGNRRGHHGGRGGRHDRDGDHDGYDRDHDGSSDGDHTGRGNHDGRGAHRDDRDDRPDRPRRPRRPRTGGPTTPGTPATLPDVGPDASTPPTRPGRPTTRPTTRPTDRPTTGPSPRPRRTKRTIYEPAPNDVSGRQTRNDPPRISPRSRPTPTPRPTSRPTSRPAPTPASRPVSRPVLKPAVSRPASKPVSKPRSKPVERSTSSKRDVSRVFKNADNPRSRPRNKINTDLNYDPYHRVPQSAYKDYVVQYSCQRQESLRVFVPRERLLATERNGMLLYVRPRAGVEETIALPPNYVRGFMLAAYSDQGERLSTPIAPASILNEEPVDSIPANRPIIYGQE